MNRIISSQILKNKSEINNQRSEEDIASYHKKVQDSINILRKEIKRVEKIKNDVELNKKTGIWLNQILLVTTILLTIGFGVLWPFAQKWIGY